jgi:hypothetical protein
MSTDESHLVGDKPGGAVGFPRKVRKEEVIIH